MARKQTKQLYKVKGKIACRVNGALHRHKHGDIVEAAQLAQWAIESGCVELIEVKAEPAKPPLKPPEAVTE